MKIILREDIEKLGEMGSVVVVKDGYARNYLIPKNFAYPFVPRFLRVITSEVEQKRKDLEAQREKAIELAKSMEGLSVQFEVIVGEEDRMFGSVNSVNISTKLHELGYEIDKRKILLEKPIKSLGIFHVPIRLHPEVFTEVKISVIKEYEETDSGTESFQEAPKKEKTEE